MPTDAGAVGGVDRDRAVGERFLQRGVVAPGVGRLLPSADRFGDAFEQGLLGGVVGALGVELVVGGVEQGAFAVVPAHLVVGAPDVDELHAVGLDGGRDHVVVGLGLPLVIRVAGRGGGGHADVQLGEVDLDAQVLVPLDVLGEAGEAEFIALVVVELAVRILDVEVHLHPHRVDRRPLGLQGADEVVLQLGVLLAEGGVGHVIVVELGGGVVLPGPLEAFAQVLGHQRVLIGMGDLFDPQPHRLVADLVEEHAGVGEEPALRVVVVVDAADGFVDHAPAGDHRGVGPDHLVDVAVVEVAERVGGGVFVALPPPLGHVRVWPGQVEAVDLVPLVPIVDVGFRLVVVLGVPDAFAGLLGGAERAEGEHAELAPAEVSGDLVDHEVALGVEHAKVDAHPAGEAVQRVAAGVVGVVVLVRVGARLCRGKRGGQR